MNPASLAILAELDETLGRRGREASPEQSYTARLFAAGPAAIAQKVGEEGVELALASVSGDREHTVREAADLVYHTLVLLAYHGIPLDDVAAELARRRR